eukprot:122964_1
MWADLKERIGAGLAESTHVSNMSTNNHQTSNNKHDCEITIIYDQDPSAPPYVNSSQWYSSNVYKSLFTLKTSAQWITESICQYLNSTHSRYDDTNLQQLIRKQPDQHTFSDVVQEALHLFNTWRKWSNNTNKWKLSFTQRVPLDSYADTQLTCYSNTLPDSPVAVTKGEMVLPYSVPIVCGVIANSAHECNYKEYSDQINEIESLSEFCQLFYGQTATPMFTTQRDVFVVGFTYILPGAEVVMGCRSIDESDDRAQVYDHVTKNTQCVRASYTLDLYHLRPWYERNNNYTVITYYSHLDLGGFVSNWVVNGMVSDTPKIILNLKEYIDENIELLSQPGQLHIPLRMLQFVGICADPKSYKVKGEVDSQPTEIVDIGTTRDSNRYLPSAEFNTQWMRDLEKELEASESRKHSKNIERMSSSKLLEGYCLVFEREDEYFEMKLVDLKEVGDEQLDLANMEHMCSLANAHGIQNDNDKTLSWVRKPNITQRRLSIGSNLPKQGKDTDPHNVLRGFNAAHIQYKIIWSRPSVPGKYIYVVIWIDEKDAEHYADINDLSVLINREEAIKAGRLFPDFHLAHRTYLPSVDASSTIPYASGKIQKLDISCWDDIHVSFASSIKDTHHIYTLYRGRNNPSYRTVINSRMYLRILHSMLVDDRSMEGADFQVDASMADKTNPLMAVFALHDFSNELFYPIHNPVVPTFASALFECNNTCFTVSTWAQLDHDIRESFGEYIAFYYAFLIHYTQMLLPMMVMGFIWFCWQLAAGSIQAGGATFYVLLCVLWSTFMIEKWYQQESAFKYKFGMCRYARTEVPRSTFHGRVQISEYNGHIIEDHTNRLKYWTKIVFSLSTMVVCIGIVVTVVGEIWILKRRWSDCAEHKMAIGVINAIQIKIFNALYTKLSYVLNEFEQHRLQEDYVNHLVVKRIVFIFVNSFNSLFFMAFYDDSYANNEDRLDSLRIQLFTLFMTAIVLLNLVEVLVPNVPQWIRQYKEKRKNEEESDIEWNNVQFTGGFSAVVIKDIELQMLQPKVPSTLDNVAEIVVLHGYVMVFAVILPIMPLLAYLNALFEIRIDIYNLIGSQRPCPMGADGIGVWKAVLSIFNILSIFSNMALIAWVTELPEAVFHLGESGKIIWYFTICISMLFATIAIRKAIPDQSAKIKKAMARQQECQHLVTLLMDSKTQ